MHHIKEQGFLVMSPGQQPEAPVPTTTSHTRTVHRALWPIMELNRLARLVAWSDRHRKAVGFLTWVSGVPGKTNMVKDQLQVTLGLMAPLHTPAVLKCLLLWSTRISRVTLSLENKLINTRMETLSAPSRDKQVGRKWQAEDQLAESEGQPNLHI